MDELDQAEREKFSRLVPDFVIELRSSTDTLKDLQAKMREYIVNGVRLGWLIEPDKKRVHIYRTGSETEILENPEFVGGEDVLPKFKLKFRTIF